MQARTVFLAFVLMMLLAAVSPGALGQITWTDYEEGMAAAREEGKPVALDFGADWCVYCQKMHEETWPDSRVQAWNDSFVFIEIDGDERGDLTDRYGVEAYPTIVYVNETGAELGRTVGYRDADDLSSDLAQAHGYWNGTIDEPVFSEPGLPCGLLLVPGTLGTLGLLGAAVVFGRSYKR